jgi:hypothetical protein
VKLREAFLHAIQQVNTYGSSSLLRRVPWKDLNRIDRAAAHDSYVARRRNEAIQLCKVVVRDLENYGAHQQLAQVIGEVRIYAALREQVSVRALPESSESTPDFCIGETRKRCLYAEAKVLMPADVAAHQRLEMEDRLAWRASVEGKRGLHICESSETFYQRHGKPYDSRSPKLVAEVLVEKIQQNIKNSQFVRGPTILIASLEYLETINPPELAIQRQFQDRDSREIANGELWLAASAAAGERAVRAPEFPGENPTPELVEKRGILCEYPFIAGISYFAERHFYSIINRRRLNGASAVLIHRFSRLVRGTG